MLWLYRNVYRLDERSAIWMVVESFDRIFIHFCNSDIWRRWQNWVKQSIIGSNLKFYYSLVKLKTGKDFCRKQNEKTMNLELNALDAFYFVGALMVAGIAFIYWLDAVSSTGLKTKRHASAWKHYRQLSDAPYLGVGGINGAPNSLGRSHPRPDRAKKKVRFDFSGRKWCNPVVNYGNRSD